MNTTNNRKVLQNASWIIVCKVVQSLLSLVVGMMSARFLGPSNYGLINYAASITAFFVPIMQLGLRSTLVRELIQYPHKEGQTLGTAIVLNLISSVACIAGIICIVSVSDKGDPESILVCALYSTNLIFQAAEMIQYWYQAKLLSKYTSLVSVAAYCVASAYRIYLIVTHKSIYWFALSQTLDFFVISSALFLIYRKKSSQKLSFSFKRGKEMLHISKYYIISSMMVTIFAHTDSIMLKLMVGETATGLYAATLTISTITSFVFGAIIDSLRPSILEARKTDEKSFRTQVRSLNCTIIYLALIQSIFVTLFSGFIIRTLYGEAYNGSIGPLRIVIWYTTFSYLGSARNVWILAEEKQSCLWIINLSGALGNVLLNACLIPQLGVNGAAIASVVTQFFTNILLGFLMKPIRPYNKLLLQSLAPRNMLRLIKRS